MFVTIENSLRKAIDDGNLMPSAYENIQTWLKAGFLPHWALNSIKELVEQKAWIELNDRFYQNLSFGTGGMRSRTIGKIISPTERGDSSKNLSPLYAAVGTNMLNDFNIIRTTIGLYRYCLTNLKINETPKLVIAHDVRYFSRHFCLLTASTWKRLGGDVSIFDGPRSTPQLSFTIRYLHATAGVVITASHNPPYDNGYKVYYKDGGQIISPHTERIIEKIAKSKLSDIQSHLTIEEQGIEILDKSVDEAYLNIVLNTMLDSALVKAQKPKIVYSPLHGTGQVIAIPAMKKSGVDLSLVEEQMLMDPRFPTVTSPNPENSEALSMAIKKAEYLRADAVIATDPDGDRMGVAVQGPNGHMMLLNGNVIGALLAEYRITKIKKLGWIPENGTQSAAIIKTFVTTNLQEAIGKQHGLKVINTLTGFKWIGSKLNDYELELIEKLKTKDCNIIYNDLSSEQRRKLLLENSTYYIFGGEESYGYLADDHVRDKDANAAAIQFCELTAYLKEQKVSFEDYLNQIYFKYGYYTEIVFNFKYEGALGAEKIERILKSYSENPPQVLGNMKVSSICNFEKDEIFDADHKRIPKEEFYFVYLDNGYSYAVRASGTEPKIKFYLFAYESITKNDSLAEIKKNAASKLNYLKSEITNDVENRIK